MATVWFLAEQFCGFLRQVVETTIRQGKPRSYCDIADSRPDAGRQATQDQSVGLAPLHSMVG